MKLIIYLFIVLFQPGCNHNARPALSDYRKDTLWISIDTTVLPDKATEQAIGRYMTGGAVYFKAVGSKKTSIEMRQGFKSEVTIDSSGIKK